MSNIRRLSIFCPKFKYTGIECTVYPVKWTYVQLQSRLPHQPKKTDFSENLVCEYFVSGYHIIQLRLASYHDLIDQKKFLSNIRWLSIFAQKSSTQVLNVLCIQLNGLTSKYRVDKHTSPKKPISQKTWFVTILFQDIISYN